MKVALRCNKIEIEIRPDMKGDINRTRSTNNLWGSVKDDIIDPDFPGTYPDGGLLVVVIRAEVTETVKDTTWPYRDHNQDQTLRVITDDVNKGLQLLDAYLDAHPQYFRDMQ